MLGEALLQRHNIERIQKRTNAGKLGGCVVKEGPGTDIVSRNDELKRPCSGIDVASRGRWILLCFKLPDPGPCGCAQKCDCQQALEKQRPHAAS